MRVCNLASGSAGNCTYVEGDETKILVDCGLTIHDLSARLGMLGVTIDDIDAVVVSHEHIDHIKSVATLSKSITKKFMHMLMSGKQFLQNKATSIQLIKWLFLNCLLKLAKSK